MKTMLVALSLALVAAVSAVAQDRKVGLLRQLRPPAELQEAFNPSFVRSDLAVFRAEAVEEGPVALAELPHRVPHGFHGNWRPA